METINFDLEKAKQGYSIVTVDGTPVLQFQHFSTSDNEHNCVAVVKGRILLYNQNGMRPRKYWNSPNCLDLRLIDPNSTIEPDNDFLRQI